MKNHKVIFFMILLAVPLTLGFLTSCGGGGETLAGRYVCTEHWNEDMVGRISFEFRDDGTVRQSPMGGDGTYEISDGYVTVVNDLLEDGITLKIEGNSLRIANPMGDVVYTKE